MGELNGAALPRLPALSLFDDGSQSLYRDYEPALLAEKRAYWDVIDAHKIAEERLQEVIAEANARLRYRESWQGWLRWQLGRRRRRMRRRSEVGGRSR